MSKAYYEVRLNEDGSVDYCRDLPVTNMGGFRRDYAVTGRVTADSQESAAAFMRILQQQIMDSDELFGNTRKPEQRGAKKWYQFFS
jgi:uncharacterized glyoxalase superfamily metalloenzyme YdcJ